MGILNARLVPCIILAFFIKQEMVVTFSCYNIATILIQRILIRVID